MRQKQSIFSLFLLSPSSRRAWIEIAIKCCASNKIEVALLAEGVDRNGNITVQEHIAQTVALLAEGVDRNNQILEDWERLRGRPPRGGRG